MKFITLIVIIFVLTGEARSQDTLFLPLHTELDTIANGFTYIQPSVEHYKFSYKKNVKRYTTSRSLALKSINKTLPVLMGQNFNNTKFIIFDTNMNNNFSDDEEIYFKDTISNVIKGNYKNFNNIRNKNYSDMMNIDFDYTIINPGMKIDLGDTLENNFFFAVRPRNIHTTIKNIGKYSYKFVFMNKYLYDYSRRSSYLTLNNLSIVDSAKKATELSRYALGDIVKIGDDYYNFNKVSAQGDTITLIKIKSDSLIYGNKIGFVFKNFREKDVVTNEEINTKLLAGKYILLDFWGTWCKPCVELFPDMKILHKQFGANNLAMIGVCSDTNEEKVKKFLVRNEISWLQIFNTRNTGQIIKQFDVSEFPSFILIDPDGKIINREVGASGYERMKKALSKLR